MSASLLEVIEAGGFDINKYDDANWLLSKQSEFESLIERAEEVVEAYWDAVEAADAADAAAFEAEEAKSEGN